MTSSVDGAEIAVGVWSSVGEPGSTEDDVTVGVVVDSTVVAFPVGQEIDSWPVEAEAVIAPLPLDVGDTVERRLERRGFT